MNASKTATSAYPATDPRVTPRQARPVLWWATFGALWLTFMAFVLISWISGPYFTRVPVGPTDPPMYMKVFLMTLQVTMIPAMLGLLWCFVVRPWRRERTVTVDGALTLAFCTLFFQDPLSNYFGPWITYNSWSWNRGSWVNSVPGWMSFGAPGATVVEPPMTIIGLYVVIMTVAVRIGVATLKWASARWPQLSKVGLFLICYTVMFVFDVVFEGVTFMPLGVWTYAGGHWNIFGNTYHAFPLHEALLVGILLSAYTFLRFFVDDRGRTIVERGSERAAATPAGQGIVRALAIIGAVNAIFLGVYTLPHLFVGAHSRPWNDDVQRRSYFLDGICGGDTGRACPGPAIPLVRTDNSGGNGGSAYVGTDGTLHVPPGTRLPAKVEIEHSGSGR
ncbi:spirocyclase AveC family protein [Mycolicibacterium sp. CBMA 234]|uniref:spirocyclase AveC family protein n=1 Tax=Mycolicibacterium sp. CBMA 234 TaxID=1918495 RepID=UPI0012DEA1BB|nr:spirocyclase AveC family protein [Mycolicibacterium sp. CBMA 234]